MKTSWKRTFYTIYSGQTVSLMTSDIVQYALLWRITAETGSAAMLSVAMFLGFLPAALGSPLIGSFADRHNRKTIMLAADGGIALVTAALVLLSLDGQLSTAAILTAMFLRALGSAFHAPCLQAVTPLIVPTEALAKANGQTYTFLSLSSILSPAIAAALYAVLPLWMILLLDLLGAACGMLTIAISAIPKLPQQAHETHIVQDALEGLRVLRKERGIWGLVWISALFSLAYIPVCSLYPLMSLSYFGGTTTHAGIVETMFSVGMLAGGAILGVWGGTKNKMHTMAPAVLVLGVSVVGMGLLPPSGFPAFAVLTALSGLSAPFFSSLFLSILQEKIAPEFLGRVLGVSTSIMSIAGPVGLIFSGLFAERVGITHFFLIGGGVTVVCAALCLALPHVRRIDLPEP